MSHQLVLTPTDALIIREEEAENKGAPNAWMKKVVRAFASSSARAGETHSSASRFSTQSDRAASIAACFWAAHPVAWYDAHYRMHVHAIITLLERTVYAVAVFVALGREPGSGVVAVAAVLALAEYFRIVFGATGGAPHLGQEPFL